MKRTCLGLAVMIMSLCLGISAFAADEPASGIVASVNGAPITQNQLDLKLNQIAQQFAAQGRMMTDEQKARLEGQMLDRLVNETLLYQKSQKEGITVTPEEVSARLEDLTGRFESKAQFEEAIAGMSMSMADLKEMIQQNIAVQKLIDQTVVPKVRVSEDESKQFYETNPNLFVEPEKIRASHILIRVAPDASAEAKADAKDRISDIKQQLAEGKAFDELAKQYSEGPSKDKGGDLGYFAREQMVKPFSDAAFALTPGQVSDPVETRFGYHLIKVAEKKPSSTVPFETVSQQIAQHLTKQRINEALGDYLKQLRKEATIEKHL